MKVKKIEIIQNDNKRKMNRKKAKTQFNCVNVPYYKSGDKPEKEKKSVNDVINPGFLTAEQAAAYVGMKPRNLAVWRKAGIIKFVKAGKRYFYRREWVEETMNRFAGYDISNPDSIALAINSIAWREKNEPKGRKN